jgi:hypothetical protein
MIHKFFEYLHDIDDITQCGGQDDVFRFGSGEGNCSLKFRTPNKGTVCKPDDMTSA